MDYTSLVHVVDRVEHLMEEEAAGVLTHGPHRLAEVKEETSLDELHDDEDEVLDDTARGLKHLPGIAILTHADDALVL